MKLVYVSGPYRSPFGPHYVRRNILKAERVAAKLWAMGFAVICPHMNCAYIEGLISDDDVLKGELYTVQKCDGVVMVPRWEKSVGSNMERDHAFKRGIPVFYWPTNKLTLKHWNEGHFNEKSIVKEQYRQLGYDAAHIGEMMDVLRPEYDLKTLKCVNSP